MKGNKLRTISLEEPHHSVRVEETPPAVRARDVLLHVVLEPLNGGAQLWNPRHEKIVEIERKPEDDVTFKSHAQFGNENVP